MASAAILMKQFRELTDPKTGVPSFHITLQNDDIYHWYVCSHPSALALY